MTTIHPPEDGKALLKSLRRRLELLERHHHPSIEQQLAEGQTRPKAPTDVTYAYVTVSDVPAVRTQWEPPTENIDDTPLTDLAGYEVEHQVGGDLLYDDPDALTPLRSEQGLNGLHDTRGLPGRHVIGGSNGASTRLPGDIDAWLWADALIGSRSADGTANATSVYNALTFTQGLNRTSLQSRFGSSNLLAGVPLQLTGATSASDASFTVNGYASTRLTASASSVDAWFEVPAAAGERFALMAHHQSAAGQIGWEFRGAGGVLASAFQSVVAGPNAILTTSAPAQATALRFYVFRATGQTSGQVVARFVKAGVMVSDHLSLSWRSTVTQEQFTNVFTNPDGRTPSTGSYSQLVATNLSTNPSFLVDTTGLTGVNSATVDRVVSASAFVGIAHAQVRRGANGNAEFFRVGTPTVTTGLVTARIRVRRGSPLLSEASTLTVTAQALNGGTVTASGAAQVVELTDEWKAVTVQVTVPAGSSTVRVSGSASGGAWSASDLVDIDGVEFYQGAAPLGYFDGSTTPADGFTHAWTGTAGQSTSTKTATHVRRINHFRNPRLASATNVSAVAGATTSVTSGQVAVTTTASGQGVRFTQQTAFPIGAVVSARVLVSGSGTVRMVINGTPVVQSEQVILGGSQERAVTLSVLLTGTSTLTVDVLATGAASFSVRDVLIEQGAAGPYFNGASAIPGRTAAWEGAVDASRSIEALPTPQSWSPVDATRERLAFDEETRLASAGMVDVAALKETSTLQARISSTGLTSGQATVAAAVVAPAGTTVQISATFSNAATATSEVFLPGEPVRHTFTIPAGATSSTFTFTFTGSFAALSKVRVGEVTLVQGAYSGPTFTGAMTATPGATAAWSGAADASTSVLTLSAADQSGDGKPVSLVAATDLGLPPSHFLSPQDVFLVGSTLYVFYVGYSLAPSATSALGKVRTGKTYLASFEAAGGRFLGAQEWPAPSTGTWGTAVAADATWLYVYGTQGGSVQVARAPLANPMDVTYWTGAAWASSGTPAVVAAGADGFHGVRLIGSKWTALEVSAGGTQLSKWTADNPQGPFTAQGTQGTWTGLPRTHPRFHPQFDDPSQGIVISTTDSDDIRFQVGPPGTPSPSFDLEIWGDRQSVTDPEHYILDIEPGTPFRVRVRAVTADGRVSDWELGEPSVYAPVAPGIQVPAPPAVAIHFRGARVFVRNEDVAGEPFPGFLGFELHMSLQENFEPSPSTLIVERNDTPSLEYVWVPDYRTYYLGVVFKTVYGRSVMSETVAFNGERLSDPDLAGVLIDGAKIAKGTLNLESLTVGSFGNSLVANPGFEVLSQFDPSKPASWQAGHARQPGGGGLEPQDTGDFFVDESSPMEGARSLRIDTYATSSRQVISEPFPLVPGDIYYVALRLRSSILYGDIKVTVRMGETLEDLNVEPETATSVISPVFSTVGSFTPQLFEGQLEVPSILSGQPMYWGAVSIEALHVGMPYSTWVDAVEVRQIVGTAAIANASINNAKIANLAVDDSKITNLDAGKITSGFISGDRIAAGSLTVSQVGGLATSLAQKATTFAQDSVPTSLSIGDLWIDTNDGNKMYRAASVGANQVGVGQWQLLEQPAAQTTLTFVDPNPPISQHVGDLWFDSDDGNKMYRAASVGTTSIGTGHWEAVAASTTVTFAQNDPPTSVNIGDLWIDTNDNNRMYRASAAGSSASWVSVEPDVVSTVTFAQDSIPTSLNEGDLWFDTDNGNKMYRAAAAGVSAIGWNGWVWAGPPVTGTFAQPSPPVAGAIGDIWVDTDNDNKLYRAASVGADQVAAGEWELISSTTVRTFLQSTAPVSVNIGDLWIHTGNRNRPYRAASIGADSINAGEWEPVATETITTFAQPGIPTSLEAGDVWYDTDDGNKPYRAAAAGVSTIGAGGWVALPPAAVQTYAQAAPPVAKNVGDLWIDTDDFNKFYRAVSVGADQVAPGEWVLVETPNVSTFLQAAPPTSVMAGDLWIDTDDDNKMYRAAAAGVSTVGAGGWVAVKPVAAKTFAQPGIPVASNAGDLWIDTDDNNRMYRAAAAGADQIAAGEWELVESALTTTFAQATVPVALNAGDLWINTSGGGNKMYRAVVAGADAIAAGEWVLVAQPAAVTFLQDEPPVAQNIGDIWVDTNDGNRMYRAGSIGADQVAPGEWVLIDNTIFQEAATIVDGWRFTGTTEINGGKIKTDTVEAGALKIGVIRSNLVPDGSLEETYAFTPWDPFDLWAGVGGTYGDITRWRRGADPHGSTIARDTTGAYARSGNGAVLLTASAHAEAEVALISPSIPLQVGKTYRLTLNALSVGGQAVLSVAGHSNSNPNITGQEGSQTLTSDEYTGWVHPPVVPAPTADAPIDKRLFKRYAWTFTATNTWMMLRLMNFRPLVASTLVLDDIAIVEVGIGGAVEVGPHGIRLFDTEGFEASSWVTNRPSRFAIATEDVEVAAIDEDGNISGQSGSFAGRLSTLGKPLLGELEAFVPAGAENMGDAWLDMMPRGLVGHARRTLGTLSNGTTNTPLFEVMWKAEPGRSYEIVFGGLLGSLQNVDRHAGFILRNATPTYTADATGVASDPASGGTTLAHSYDARTSTNDGFQTFPARVVTVRCNREGMTGGGEVNPGYNRLLLIHVPANSGTLTPASPDNVAIITVKDIGPDAPDDSVLNGGGGGIVTKKNYSSVWVANSSRVYNSNGAVATGSGGGTLYDLVHGPVPGTNNNRHSLALFTGGAVSGETGKTMASALTGATIHKVEVYLYARHWYYSSGTAYIRSYTSGTTLPATLAAPGGTPQTKGSWAKGVGMWVDVTAATDMTSTSLRGVIVGATGTTNLLTYGRFDGATQQHKPQLRVSYSR